MNLSPRAFILISDYGKALLKILPEATGCVNTFG